MIPTPSGTLFHGPAFQYLRELRRGPDAAPRPCSTRGTGSVPRGAAAPGAARRGDPRDPARRALALVVRDPARRGRLSVPDPRDPAARAACRIAARCGSRRASPGFDGDPRFPAFDLQLLDGERLLVALRLVEVLLPKGPIGTAPSAIAPRVPARPDARPGHRAVARRRRGDACSRRPVVRGSDWLPGNVARIYGVPSSRGAALLAEVAVRDHVARTAFVHPSRAPRWRGAGARLRRARGRCGRCACTRCGRSGAARSCASSTRDRPSRISSPCARTGASASASARGRSRISTTA